MHVFTASRMFLSLLVGSTLVAAPALAQTSSARLSRPRAGLAATSVGSKALFAGGVWWSILHPGFWVTLDVVDIYDDSTGTWALASLSQPREGLAATSVGSLAIFAGGRRNLGGDDWAYSDVVDIFDDSTGQWTTASLSQARGELVATSVGTLAIFAGGIGDGGTSDVVDIFDVSTGTWSTASLSAPRFALAATSVGGKALFAGGRSVDSGPATSLVDVYDLVSGTWSQASLSMPRAEFATTTLGPQAIFAGEGNTAHATADIYDVQTDSWSVLASSTYGQLGIGGKAAVAGDRAIFADGGECSIGCWTGSGVFDSTGEWSVRWDFDAPFPVRSAATSVGGKALFAGGYDWTSAFPQFTMLDRVDIYDAAVQPSCTPSSNSTGSAAVLQSQGSLSLGDNTLTLLAHSVPDEPFVFFHGSSTGMAPFGDGQLCIGGRLTRILPAGIATGNLAQQVVDLPSAGLVAPGTRYFQCWYRDSTAGGAGFNASSSLELTFTP